MIEQIHPCQAYSTDQMAKTQIDQITYQYTQRMRDIRNGVMGMRLTGFRPVSEDSISTIGIRTASSGVFAGFSAAASALET